MHICLGVKTKAEFSDNVSCRRHPSLCVISSSVTCALLLSLDLLAKNKSISCADVNKTAVQCASVPRRTSIRMLCARAARGDSVYVNIKPAEATKRGHKVSREHKFVAL